MKKDFEELIQALILQELTQHPEGLTEKQIHKAINKKLKLIKQYKINQEKNEKILKKLLTN